MSEIRVASRYAKSLFDLATERNLLDKVETDAHTFLDLVRASRQFNAMLKSPVIHMDKKWHIIEKSFRGKVDLLTMEFIKIVLRKRRDEILPDIFQQFLAMYREHKNIISATVYTAVPINDKIKSEVEAYLSKKAHAATIELKNEVRQDLLGGFVIRYEDKLVDASVASQLKALRNQLINAN